MSFMFNPYDYVDPRAVNRPRLDAALGGAISVGGDKVARRLLSQLPEHGALFLDGYVGADFAALASALTAADENLQVIDVSVAYKSSEVLEKMLAASLPEDRVIDPVLLFGRFNGLNTLISLLFTCLAVFAVYVPAILELVDSTCSHSGDSNSVYPSFSI
ncbi:MAG: hypothetical protein IJJ28_07335, partial [Lentisphaeria bacterium]|nr:hypothetical protein [Lentisphaeria bacterium]